MLMNLEDIIDKEISQLQKDTAYMIALVGGTWSDQIHRDNE